MFYFEVSLMKWEVAGRCSGSGLRWFGRRLCGREVEGSFENVGWRALLWV